MCKFDFWTNLARKELIRLSPSPYKCNFTCTKFLSCTIYNIHIGSKLSEGIKSEMGRPPYKMGGMNKKGSWTPEEDLLLLSYVQENGVGDWKSVPDNTGMLCIQFNFISFTEQFHIAHDMFIIFRVTEMQ